MIKEVPSHGVQGEPATTDVSLQVFETAGEPLCPSIAEVAEMAASVVRLGASGTTSLRVNVGKIHWM